MTAKILTLLVSLAGFAIGDAIAQFTQEWARIYPSAPNEFAEAVDIQMDAQGNIYTLGFVPNDMLLIKYNPAGDTLWTRRVANSGRPLKVELDQSGNPVAAVGATLRKYNPSGGVLWTKNVPGALYTMSIDSLDNVLVGTASLIDIRAFKYASNGDSLWRRTHPASGFPTASTTDGAGNLYLAASVFSGGSPNMLAIKLTPTGDTAWVRSYDRMGFSEYPNDIEVDGQGNVVVVGYSSTSGQLSGKDYAVVKYSPTGELLWQRHFNGPADGEDQINDIDIDVSGEIYSTGVMTAANGVVAGTLKLSSSGDSIWASYGFDSGSRSLVDGNAGRYVRALDPFAAILVTGQMQNTIMLSALDIAGPTRFFAQYSSAIQEQVLARSTLRMFGQTSFPTHHVPTLEVAIALHRVVPFPPASSIHTVKFSSPLTGVDGNDGSVPETFALHQNYPNPFNPSTTISYQLTAVSFVSLKVYDLLGRQVAALVSEEKQPGSYEVQWDASGFASGMYVYRLQAGSLVETRKLILLR